MQLIGSLHLTINYIIYLRRYNIYIIIYNYYKNNLFIDYNCLKNWGNPNNLIIFIYIIIYYYLKNKILFFFFTD